MTEEVWREKGCGVFAKAVVPIYNSPADCRELGEKGEAAVSDEGLYGQQFAVLWEGRNCFKIRTSYSYEGYVRRRDVLFLTERAWAMLKCSSRPMWVVKPYADVLGAAFVKGRRLISLAAGAIIYAECGRKAEEYTRVKLYDGRNGYIKTSYLAPYAEPVNGNAVCQTVAGKKPALAVILAGSLDEAEFRRGVVETAKEYLGTQYRWGGKSPLGIDCSGLTSMAYMRNGVLIFRDAKIEPDFPVHEIEYEDKKPGDLLYFPGHVAMYTGDGEYIHSTARAGSDGVVMNSLNPDKENFRADLPERILAVGSIF